MFRVYKQGTIYKKTFKTYTIVIVGIVLTLELFFYFTSMNQMKGSRLDNNRRMTEQAAAIVMKMSDDTNKLHETLYQSESELYDILYYLDHDMKDYLQYRLETYSNNNKNMYQGMDYFMEQVLNRSNNIQKASLVSYIKKDRIDYYKSGQIKLTREKVGEIPYNYQNIYANEGNMTLVREIRNPDHFKVSGGLEITYDLSSLESLTKGVPDNNIILFDKDGTIYFQSENSVNKDLHTSYKSFRKETMEKQMNAYVNLSLLDDGLILIGYIDKKDAVAVPGILLITMILIGLFIFALGEWLIHLHLKTLSERMKHILDAMVEVTKGNLEVSIDSGKENDELSIITSHFNQMCKDLDLYIRKSYMAEIEQKNAQMSALQSQINPHFLYNTLEAIRMKAISSGDTVVGKMLYGLAVIFRSQIKEANIIPLAKELHYCKKYLELFEFRYQNKFHFQIICAEELMNYPVIKFVIQPIIENYFVHGIRLEQADNFIKIEAYLEEAELVITIEDNGRGISKEQLIITQDHLLSSSHEYGDSIGVINVHKRMTASYGDGYGVTIRHNEPSGLRVILRFKDTSETEGEDHNLDINSTKADG